MTIALMRWIALTAAAFTAACATGPDGPVVEGEPVPPSPPWLSRTAFDAGWAVLSRRACLGDGASVCLDVRENPPPGRGALPEDTVVFEHDGEVVVLEP